MLSISSDMDIIFFSHFGRLSVLQKSVGLNLSMRLSLSGLFYGQFYLVLSRSDLKKNINNFQIGKFSRIRTLSITPDTKSAPKWYLYIGTLVP